MQTFKISALGKIIWLLIISLLIILVVFVFSLFKKDSKLSNVKPVSNNEQKVINYVDIKTNQINFDDDSNIKASNNVILLSDSASYKLKGFNEKYKIVVDAPNKVVKIILSNFKTNIVEDLIDVRNANKLIIELEENTMNEIKQLALEEENLTDLSGSTIINSKSDISFTGEGSLTVDSTNNFFVSSGNVDFNTNIELLNINTAFQVEGNVNITKGILYINSNTTTMKTNGSFKLDDGRVIIKSSVKPIEITGVFLINGGEILLASLEDLQIPNANSLQKTFILSFAEPTNKSLILHNTQKVIMAYDGKKDYQHLLYSSSKLDDNNYILYAGGSIAGDYKYDIYTEVSDYLEDYQLTAPNLVDNTFTFGNLINTYSDIVKKWQLRLSFFYCYNKIMLEVDIYEN